MRPHAVRWALNMSASATASGVAGIKGMCYRVQLWGLHSPAISSVMPLFKYFNLKQKKAYARIKDL